MVFVWARGGPLLLGMGFGPEMSLITPPGRSEGKIGRGFSVEGQFWGLLSTSGAGIPR